MENIIKAVYVKAKNKRFKIVWLKNNSVAFSTKTLQDFKKRIITQTSGVYSIESFLLLTEMFQLIYDDADFKKVNNPTIGQHQKSKIKYQLYQ